MNHSFKPITILMAEDDADDRLLAQDALEESGLEHDLRFVDNGEDLMDYLLRRGAYDSAETAPRPRLIILDLNMPRKDGREALEEIKSHPDLRKIPLVVLTTSRSDIDVARIYELGANSFITKPVTYDQLVNVMTLLGKYWFGIVETPNAA